MSIISQNNTKSELSNSISSFFSKYHIGNLLRKCNANKEKGVPVIRIFMYKLCNVFKKASMYMQMKTDSYHESQTEDKRGFGYPPEPRYFCIFAYKYHFFDEKIVIGAV